MPAADATVEYILAAAKQTAEEVDDPVLAVANLADHSADQHEECNDERVPQAEREHQIDTESPTEDTCEETDEVAAENDFAGECEGDNSSDEETDTETEDEDESEGFGMTM